MLSSTPILSQVKRLKSPTRQPKQHWVIKISFTRLSDSGQSFVNIELNSALVKYTGSSYCCFMIDSFSLPIFRNGEIGIISLFQVRPKMPGAIEVSLQWCFGFSPWMVCCVYSYLCTIQGIYLLWYIRFVETHETLRYSFCQILQQGIRRFHQWLGTGLIPG